MNDSGDVMWKWAGLVLFGGMVVSFSSLPHHSVLAGNANVKQQDNAEAGRSVFNGKGVCYYCHGVDGHRDKVPHLEADTVALIAQLNPQPADLRHPGSLKLNTDKQRVRAIREGHPGTGMFPDTTLTDREVKDLLAYLAMLRQQTSKETGKP